MRTKGHCVIVVAEGCGDTLIQSSGETDAGSQDFFRKAFCAKSSMGFKANEGIIEMLWMAFIYLV